MKRIKKFCKDKDDYGHAVQLNYDGQDEVVNTSIGGCMSFVARVCLALYFALLLKQCFIFENSNYKTLHANTNKEEQSNVSFKDIGEGLIILVKNRRRWETVDREELLKYVKIRSVFNGKRRDVTPCNKSNFEIPEGWKLTEETTKGLCFENTIELSVNATVYDDPSSG
jgi:hypothetical protein